MHDIISKLLLQRGISLDEQDRFLHPDFERDLHSGKMIKGMDRAVERIQKAMQSAEKITIFGDYDADGVPATALLVRCFARLGVGVDSIIPTRESGYGLSDVVVKDLITGGTTLLITVDNGTVSGAEIRALKEAGIDTIVCDHHQPQEGALAVDALAILNPKQSDCPYPFKELCGCALAWKLMVELYTTLGLDTSPLKWELDLVAFSTIADMVPLLGENRVLAHFGLKVIRQTRNLGLQALAAVAGVKLEDINCGGVGFYLAPRINAPSRMHQELLHDGQNAALRLLTTDNKQEAFQIAHYLQEQNSGRQGLLESHLKEAEELVQADLDNCCLILFKSEWSTGVIGLVAGRLMERYQRPVVVLAPEGAVIKGSVRSVDGVHAVDMVAAASDLIERFGGHSKAAGLSLKVQADVTLFKERLNNWVVEQGWTVSALSERVGKRADLVLPLAEATLELAENLKALEPFGIGFPNPIFETTARITNVRRVGSVGQHLSLFLEEGLTRKKAIGFGLGNQAVEEGREYKVLFCLTVEEWNGVQSAGCHIQKITAL